MRLIGHSFGVYAIHDCCVYVINFMLSMTHDFVGTILTVGMYLLAMHLSHTHSAESSVVRRLYASSLIPVHSLKWNEQYNINVCNRTHPITSPNWINTLISVRLGS